MAILAFQQPDKVVMLQSDEQLGKFEFRPLEPGYGVTVGNALRRILLGSLEGFAITAIKIQGVDHEFATIKGVVEDVTELVLNLKQVRFKQQISDTDSESVILTVHGKEQFTAGDIGKHTSAFQVLNPDMVICNMENDVKIQMELQISKGRGYLPAEENKDPNASMGTIAMDAIFTPIRNVKFEVDNYRV
ncbi:MAG: DNA-directed RNA polymerase subunit alpha, partial [Bacteroidia bacterium]|nr:DNA-directed RNA polymerase subunit alpha [Bacteroidia bacterium]